MYFNFHPCLQGTQYVGRQYFKEKTEVVEEVFVLVEYGEDGNHHQGSRSQTLSQLIFISLSSDVISDDRN